MNWNRFNARIVGNLIGCLISMFWISISECIVVFVALSISTLFVELLKIEK